MKHFSYSVIYEKATYTEAVIFIYHNGFLVGKHQLIPCFTQTVVAVKRCLGENDILG